MAAARHYKDAFEKKHGVKLGFMGFFAKAVVAALKELPNVNAEIEGDNIVYKNYYDIGIAVSTERGLVVPVVRDADQLSLAGVEKAIVDFGTRARDNKLKIEELQGGTFSITNGGVFGSLMSTPILNAPQSGILGMHKIQPRPMAIGDKIEIRPMMYLALSYDHRIVDGREAVTFLVRVKENLEDPQRMLLDVLNPGRSPKLAAFVAQEMVHRTIWFAGANRLITLFGSPANRLRSCTVTKGSNAMAYVDGFVIPVPEGRLDDYKDFARRCAKIWREHGAIACVECVGDDVPYGELTSFPRGVQAKEDENLLVFSWIVYSSRQSRDEVMKKVLDDDRLKNIIENPPSTANA